jgi:hypothetical protein
MPAMKARPTSPLGYRGLALTFNVRHPPYLDCNTLVKLLALDADSTVNYEVALIICGIISANSWSTG